MIISKQKVQQIQAIAPNYASFINDQIDYAKQLEALKYMMLE